MRKIILLFYASFLAISCNNQNQSKMINISNNEKLIKQYFELFNQHDWKKMSEMYTETADFKDPSLGKGIVKQSRKQTEEKYAELHKIFPDLHDEVIQIYPSGENHIIVEFVSTGNAPDNSKFELPICTIFTIDNGLITKDFTYFDNFEEEGEE
ncbi:nuclear transport factor 2 family protein [Flavobacterium sp. MMLR14_040]|uniref:nuclear transport factor 2 family protein n=1 Tax=Flavobacterium sp. MMLR14_040 TaxID=3093843 RepID=UPI00298F4E73|nr:nuclear transport factor 2 family protein [Flavobacterium sp. MMLR14_040]MDW8852022.1 nuclear transport factor 2 family protein [Flavobacterium sp. MMLR14_040]